MKFRIVTHMRVKNIYIVEAENEQKARDLVDSGFLIEDEEIVECLSIS
jgi:hypothetical protein